MTEHLYRENMFGELVIKSPSRGCAKRLIREAYNQGGIIVRADALLVYVYYIGGEYVFSRYRNLVATSTTHKTAKAATAHLAAELKAAAINTGKPWARR